MFTASTDKTLGIWDYETGARIKKLKGHSSFINSCYPSRRGPQYVVSGADDCTVKVCFIIVSFFLVETRRKSSKAMILLGVLKFKQSNLKLKIVLFLKYAHSFCVMKVHVKCFIFGYCFACLK